MLVLDNIIGFALDFITGLASGIGDMWLWLNTPVAIGENTITPIDAVLPAGLTVFLVIVVLQIIKKTVPLV